MNKKEDTTRNAILKALLSLGTISANDSFVLYIASHGVVVDKTFYILTSNITKATKSNIKENAISEMDLKNLLRRIPTANKLLLLDACYAGDINKNITQNLAKRSPSQLNITSITASNSQQVALEGYADGHGIFTYVLTEALDGNADINKDGVVQTMELVNYVTKMVPIEAKKYDHTQIPDSFQSGQVFNVSLSRGFTGRVDMKPQYYNPKEIEQLKKFMKNNNLKGLNDIISKKQNYTKNIVGVLDSNTTKKYTKAKAQNLDKKFTFAKSEMIFNDNYIFLNIKDKLKQHSGFKDPKGRNVIFFDFYSNKKFDKIKKELNTKKVSNIFMASRQGGWYRITLETKTALDYTYETTNEWFIIKLKNKNKTKDKK
jgi:hypothetical protein